MESKARALKGYKISLFQTIIAEYFCCLSRWFKKGKLLGSGQLKVIEPNDPNIILWENMGVGMVEKIKNRVYTISMLPISLAFCYVGQYYWQRIAKSLKDLERSECLPGELFDMDDAWIDHLLPMEYKLGKMNCYCQHMYTTYGDSGYKLIFADGE